MAMKFPLGSLTFEETSTTLGLTTPALMRVIAHGLIVPSSYFQGHYTAYSFEEWPDGQPGLGRGPFWNELCTEFKVGCYYLVLRAQTGPALCEWSGFSEARTADGGEMFYHFDEPFTIHDVCEKCCFTRDEIERFQREHTMVAQAEDDKPLHVKERKSMLTMIITLAIHGYGYDPKVTRSDVPKEILTDIEQLGLELSIDTVRNLLKEAAKLLG